MKKKPNFIFILTDDQGPWALHCAGTEELSTPNLDALAAEGLRFDNFFCASPVCSPSRASILTGKIPSAHGVQDWIRSGNIARELCDGQDLFGDYSEERTPTQYLAGEKTYTDILSQHGYECALSGKWHLGDSMNPQHGHSQWYTIGKGEVAYFQPDIIEDGNITKREGYITDLITDKALDFLHDFSHKESPFYLGVHYTAPHAPWGKEHHLEKYWQLYEGSQFKEMPNTADHPDSVVNPVSSIPGERERLLTGYFAAISAMDAAVGRIVTQVSELGMGEDTYIIFMSDNGMSMGHHGVWGKGNGTFPQNMYEEAIKVPCIFSCPSKIRATGVCSTLVSQLDIFPTLLELAGINAEHGDKYRPGSSFVSLLGMESQGKFIEQDIIICEEYGPVRMIRTEGEKYIHRYPYGPHEYYDLHNDPEESRNLIDSPACQHRIVGLRSRLEEWFLHYGDPLKDGLRESNKGYGQMDRVGPNARVLHKFAPE
ncbi:MAG: sulfatase-like hydrolase/transferase [Sphaerochaeta sp.]|nr:sulfatase-like hydrolase/transferase [Sphaerochaeta sp.]